MFFGQKHHANAIFAGRGQIDALFLHLRAQIRIRDLDQDAGPIAHQGIGADRTAVIEVL